jgi:hypothetical protein
MKRLLLVSLLPAMLMAVEDEIHSAAINHTIENSLQAAPQSIKDLMQALKVHYATWHTELKNRTEGTLHQQALDTAVQHMLTQQFDPAQIGAEVEVDDTLRAQIKAEADLLGLNIDSLRIYGVASETLPACGTCGFLFIVNTPRLTAHSAAAQRFIIRSNLIQFAHYDNEYFQVASGTLPGDSQELRNFDNFLTMRSDLLAAAQSADHALEGHTAVTGSNIMREVFFASYTLPTLDQYNEADRAELLAYIYQCLTRA